MDDNFSTIVDTIRDGRRIYSNIRKAVGYVFTIHIPIALSSLLAPMLGIAPVGLFLLPLHVMLLELIIDPTCSIVLERQPAEEDVMDRPPRDPKEQMLTRGSLLKSVLQGLAIFAAAFGAYFFVLSGDPANAPVARAMGLGILMLSNLLLVQVNCSDHDFIVRSIRRLARDKVMWLANAGTLAGLGAILYTPLAGVLKLAPLSWQQLLVVLGMAIAATLWYDLVKAVKRAKKRA
jgi:Ca2+-transporting ATPase